MKKESLFETLAKATKPKKPPQWKQILVWLQAGNSITFLQALRMFGCGNLKGRIFDLRKELRRAHEAYEDIDTEMIKTSSGKRIAKYTLIQK